MDDRSKTYGCAAPLGHLQGAKMAQEAVHQQAAYRSTAVQEGSLLCSRPPSTLEELSSALIDNNIDIGHAVALIEELCARLFGPVVSSDPRCDQKSTTELEPAVGHLFSIASTQRHLISRLNDAIARLITLA